MHSYLRLSRAHTHPLSLSLSRSLCLCMYAGVRTWHHIEIVSPSRPLIKFKKFFAPQGWHRTVFYNQAFYFAKSPILCTCLYYIYIYIYIYILRVCVRRMYRESNMFFPGWYSCVCACIHVIIYVLVAIFVLKIISLARTHTLSLSLLLSLSFYVRGCAYVWYHIEIASPFRPIIKFKKFFAPQGWHRPVFYNPAFYLAKSPILCTCLYICMYIYIYIYICILCVCARVCAVVRGAHKYICICVCSCIFVCVLLCIYVCVYVCTYVYIHIYVRT